MLKKTRRGTLKLPGKSASTTRKNGEVLIEQDHVKTLLDIPLTRNILVEIVSNNKPEIEQYKRQCRNARSIQYRRLSTYETPSVKHRNQLRELTLSESYNNSTNENRPIAFSHKLEHVVGFVDVWSLGINHSDEVKKLMTAMGARVVESFSIIVTHIVFQEGSDETFKMGIANGCHIVSVFWLESVKKSSFRVSEISYNALKKCATSNKISEICKVDEKTINEIANSIPIKAVYDRKDVLKSGSYRLEFINGTVTKVKPHQRVIRNKDLKGISRKLTYDENETNIEDINVQKANVNNIHTQEALSESTVEESVVKNASISKSSVENMYLSKAHVGQNKVEKPKVKRTNAKNCTVQRSNLEKANIEHINVENTNVRKVNVESTKIKNSTKQVNAKKTSNKNINIRRVNAERPVIEKTNIEMTEIYNTTQNIKSTVENAKQQSIPLKKNLGTTDNEVLEFHPTKKMKLIEESISDADGAEKTSNVERLLDDSNNTLPKSQCIFEDSTTCKMMCSDADLDLNDDFSKRCDTSNIKQTCSNYRQLYSPLNKTQNWKNMKFEPFSPYTRSKKLRCSKNK